MSEKASLMEALRAEILGCRRCRLWETRTQAVPGDGSLDAEIMFIGEAPGYHEDQQGKPFVGAAGKLLTELLSSIGLSREEVYITNVVKCRPPGNRDPKPDEIEACSPYLDREIQIIRPRIIVTLGRHSTKYILSKAGVNVRGITQVRGRLFNLRLFGMEVVVLPTYHPAAALYNPRLRSTLEEDFAKLRGMLEARPTARQSSLEEFF